MDLIVGVPDKRIVRFAEGGTESDGAIEGEILPRCLVKNTWDSGLFEIAANEILCAIGGAVVVDGPVIELDEAGQMLESLNDEMRLILNNHCQTYCWSSTHSLRI